MIYRVEYRVDVDAKSVSEAASKGREAIAQGDGELTAVFDDEWNEVQE